MKTMRRGRMLEEGHCGDCEVAPGEFHQRGCDVEQCPFCGGQLISCGCCYKAFYPTYRHWDHEDEGTSGLPQEVYENGLPNEQDEEWDRRLEVRGRMPWTGTWPGKVECREYRWFTRWRIANDPRSGYVQCSADHPGASEDLNRLVCVWDPELKRWARPS